MTAPMPPDESLRLATLYALDLVDRPPRVALQRLVRLASKVLDMPMVVVTLVDADVQWSHAKVGFEPTSLMRSDSFCAHAILSSQIMVVNDAKDDVRFSQSWLVNGPIGVRFYAGRPFAAPNGTFLGALSVMDTKPRILDQEQLDLLEDLGALVEAEMWAVALDVFDDVTGLVNRRGLQLVADQAISRALREGETIGLVFVDLDDEISGAKTGTRASTEAIVALAAALKSCLRGSDVPARFRSDEFAVLLPDTTISQAEAVATRVKAAIKDAQSKSSELARFAAHVGFATMEPSEDQFTLAALIERADSSI